MEQQDRQTSMTTPAEEAAVELTQDAEPAEKLSDLLIETPGAAIEEPLTDITHRLADDFFVLREEFPAIRHPEQLPDIVLETAAQQNISLLDAYLRFRHEEEKRVRREGDCRREAAARSTGSLLQGEDDSHPEQEAFLRAFRSALN